MTLLRLIPIIVTLVTFGAAFGFNNHRIESGEKERKELKSDTKILLDRTARMDERQKRMQRDIKQIIQAMQK